MRFFLAALAVFSLGFGAGFAWFSRPMKAAESQARQKPHTTEGSAAVPAGSASERLLAALKQKDDPLRMGHDLWVVLQSLGPEDVRALAADWAGVLALAKRMNPMPGDSRAALADALIEKWVEVDAAGAFARLRVLSRLSWDNEFTASAIRVLAAKKPDALLEFALEQKDKWHRSLCAQALLERVAEEDPARAQSILERFPAEDRRELSYYVMVGRATLDPFAGLAMAAKEKDEVFRWGLFRAAGNALAERGRGEIALALAQHPECTGGATFYFLSKLVDRDPAGAAEIILESPTSRWNPGLFGQIAQRFAEQDPHAAMEWVARLPEKERALSEPRIAQAWAETDPKAALEWFISHPPVPFAESDPREWLKDARARAFETWLFTDETAARSWLDQQGENDAAQLARRTLASHLRNTWRDEEAAKILGTKLTVKDAGELGYSYAIHDPRRAAEWAAALPAGETQNAAIGSVIGRWTLRDRVAAEEWLGAFPAGAGRDAATRAFAVSVAERSPDDASGWVTGIEDRWQRTRAAEDIYWAWRRRDPAAAREWFTSVPGIYETLRAESLAIP